MSRVRRVPEIQAAAILASDDRRQALTSAAPVRKLVAQHSVVREGQHGLRWCPFQPPPGRARQAGKQGRAVSIERSTRKCELSRALDLCGRGEHRGAARSRDHRSGGAKTAPILALYSEKFAQLALSTRAPRDCDGPARLRSVAE
jgi:hypothetical protein